MEGIPADLTIYKDDQTGYTLRDHSYYGNGCPNNSSTPCNTRIVQTADNEDQKNGTYYHFQAATSGAGGAIETDNVNAPDTFCPLGWQMSYSGTGGDYYDKSRSWNYLFNKYSIINDKTSATKVKSYPFSYVYSGGFHWGTGLLFNQDVYGHYWSLTVNHNINSYYMLASDSGILHSTNANKANGFTIRCVYFFTPFHRRHGGRNKCLSI
ncbi:hypothetical protein IKE07_01380 [Candidatus Saccharibacteria bacterium]|nr:hypothetical protein [Candidatus Saccharibacteria bacterium]